MLMPSLTPKTKNASKKLLKNRHWTLTVVR